MKTLVVCSVVTALMASTVDARTVLLFEDFESYSSTAAVNALWSVSGANGRLVDETYTEWISLADDDPSLVGSRAFPNGGQGFEHAGSGVVEIDLAALNGGSPLFPTIDKTIILEGDIFDVGALNNKRMSVGLRSNRPENLIELGHWNSSPVGYAHRGVLFPTSSSEPNPNYQFFQLPIELDRTDDTDDLVTVEDVGEAWSTYRAIITPSEITYQIDLYRDGIVNDGSGRPGVDASVTYDLVTGSHGYDSLRIGSPSGVSSSGSGLYGGVIFDNIRLSFVPEPSACCLVLAGLVSTVRGRSGRGAVAAR